MGNAFLPLRLGGMWVRDARILRCAKPNSCIRSCCEQTGFAPKTPGPTLKRINPQRQLIQLLGFAQRRIHASCSHISAHRRGRKPFPTTLKSFGDRLRTKRLEIGLTQQQLAERLEVSKFQVGLWERGHRQPTDCQWQKLECDLALPATPIRCIPTAE